MSTAEQADGVSGDWLRSSVRRYWLLLIVMMAVGGGACYALTFLMTPAYAAAVALLPAKDADRDDMLAGLPSGVGGLASLAGVSLGGGGNRAEAFEVLRSRAVAREFIAREALLDVLYARMNERRTPERALEYFMDRVLSIAEDKRTSVVTVVITWTDRQKAADWANKYARLANERLRERAVKDAASRRSFLEREVQRTQVLELREAAYRLIENQMKSAMMAVTREDFAYQVLDPAVPPDEDDFVRPKRGLMAAAGAFAALLLTLLLLRLVARRVGTGGG